MEEAQRAEAVKKERMRDKLYKSVQTCSICLDDLLTEEGVVEVKCGHIFHAACIKDWMRKDKSCPNCKMDIGN